MPVYYQLTPFVPYFPGSSGAPLSNGTLNIYLAGTTTPSTLYTDDVGTATGAVITLNTRGYPSISGNTVLLYALAGVEYKIVLKDRTGAIIYTIDDISIDSGLRTDLAAPTGTDLVGYGSRTLTDGLAQDFINVINIAGFGASTASAASVNTPAIQAVFDTAPAGSIVYVPYGVFDINAKITAPGTIDIIMDGIFNYVGAETSGALEIGVATVPTVRRKFVLKVINNGEAYGTWTNDNHIGIKIFSPNTCEIHIRQAIGFTRGFEFMAHTQGAAYNTVYLGMIYENKIGGYLSSISTGFVNENKFYGGRFTNSSAANITTDRTGIRLTSEDGGYINHNSNTFFGPCFEISYHASNTGTLIDIVHGLENQFLEIRNENVAPSNILVQNAARDNIFTSSYGNLTITDTSSQPSSVSVSSRNKIKLNTRATWNSGHLGKLATNWNGAAGEAMLPTCDMWASSSGTPALAFGGYSIASTDYIETTSARGVGRSFDTSRIKKWLVRRSAVTGFGGRILIKAYNSAGALLTGSSPNYVTGRSGSTVAYVTTYGGGYQTGADGVADLYFNLHADVASIDVIITSGTAHIKLKSFDVTALDFDNDDSLVPFFRSVRPTEEYRFSPAVPTQGTYPAGTIIWDPSPVSGAPMGWVCSVAGTPGTWKAMANFA